MNLLPTAVRESLISEFNTVHRQFANAAVVIEKELVGAANDSRHMGLLFQELVGHNNVTEKQAREWLRKNPGQLAELRADRLLKHVHTAKAQQQEFTLFSEVASFLQTTFQCAGLLPEDSRRDGPQQSHALTPAAQSTDLFMHVRSRYTRLFETRDTWGEETRKEILADIVKACAFLDELKARL
jgi:hypothetical protein